MSTKRIINVIKKEWRIAAGDLNTLMLVTLLPLLIVGEIVLIFWLADRFGGAAMLNVSIFQMALEKLGSAIPAAASLPSADQLRLLLLSQFNFYLLLLPTMISLSLATFSLVDEKISGSLEALLATPVRTWELLLGKALSGAIPALVATWVCAVFFILAVAGMGWGGLVNLVLNPAWFISLFLLTPAVTLLSFLLGIIASARARDAKNAQSIAVLVILPVFGLIALQITGVFWFTTWLTLLLALAIIIVDIVVLRTAVSLFQRESIVTRWR